MKYKFNYLYKITNNINGNFYYGIHSTNNLNDGYMGSGKYLHQAYEKYGIENFSKEIIEFKNTRKELSDLEKDIVTIDLVNNRNCYNIKLGGDDGKLLGTATMKDENGNFYQVVIGSPEYKNMVGTWSGRCHSEETKQKMSESHKKNDRYIGKNNPSFGTCWITKDGENKKIKKEDIIIYEKSGWEIGRKLYQPVLEKLDIDKIKEDINNGLIYKDIAEKYGVHRNTLIKFIKKHNLSIRYKK